MTTEPTSDRLPGRVRYGYAAGSVVTGVFGTVPGLVLLPYLTDTIGVQAALAGLLVLLPKAWDVVCNPLAGRISDRSAADAGRRPFLLAGGIATAVLFAAMFAHPGVSGGGAAAWVVVTFLLCATAYAFFQVPYIAMPAEITDAPAERTALMTRRIAVLAVAILASGAGAPAIRDALGGVAGYRLMGVAMGVLLVAGTVWCFLGTRGTAHGRVLGGSAGLRATVAAVRQAGAFRRLLVIFVVQAVGLGTMLAGVDYVSRVVLARSGLSAVLFAAFIGPALVVMPLWQALSVRRSKAACYAVASVMFGVAALLLVALGRSAPAAIVLLAIAGAAYAGLQVFPLSLLPDLTAQEETRTGQVRAGIFAGVWTAGETLGLALGPGLYGLTLAAGGYVSGAAAADQPAGAVTAALLGFALLPAIFVLVPIPLLRKLSGGR